MMNSMGKRFSKFRSFNAELLSRFFKRSSYDIDYSCCVNLTKGNKNGKAKFRLLALAFVTVVLLKDVIPFVGTTTRSSDEMSRLLQSRAQRMALKAITLRTENQDICVTTFNITRIPKEERGILVYSAPPPLEELPATLRSWRDALRGFGKLVIFTNDPVTRNLCRAVDIPTMCLEHTDENVPRFDRMLQRMHESQPDGIVAYVNSDLSITDFNQMYEILQYLQNNELELQHAREVEQPFEGTGRMSKYWFAVATRVNVLGDGTRVRDTDGGFDFWAWNTKPDGAPLLPFDIPPFRFPFATYDNWLLDAMVQAGDRNVIDASAVIEMLHHEHVRNSKYTNWVDGLFDGLTGVYVNRYLSYSEPQETLEANGVQQSRYLTVKYRILYGTPIECPYVVEVDDNRRFVFNKRHIFSNGIGPAQRNDIIRSALPTLVTTLPIGKGFKPTNEKTKTALANWRYTMEEQLKQHSRGDGFVLLTAVDHTYRDLLMNFKCNLERVGMREHLVVAALDEVTYKWGVLQGLPIFLANGALDDLTIGDSYGSNMIKLKNQVVLDVIEAGYSVIWSDVDITWFVHPFDALAGFMDTEGGITIQSDAPFKQTRKKARPHKTVEFIRTENPAGKRRLDSGLYVAPSNPLVRAAFKEIIDHAFNSTLTEQSSFDYILCDRFPNERRSSSCTYRKKIEGSGTSFVRAVITKFLHNSWNENSMHVQLLNRFSFPNGAVLVGENNRNVYELGEKEFMKVTGERLFFTHNNWIVGENHRKKRAADAGWWFTDDKHTCSYNTDDSNNQILRI